MSFDNTMSGALFQSNEARVLRGTFSVDGKTKLPMIAQLGDKGAAHTLRIVKIVKKNEVEVATGLMKALDKPLGPFTSPNGHESMLVARGVLRFSKQSVKIVVFKVDGTFYQVRADNALQARPLAAL